MRPRESMYSKARMRLRIFVLWTVFAAAAAADEKVKLPTGKNDLAAGRKLFENQCALCHGQNGEGGRGPVLAKPRLSRAPDDEVLVRVIQSGIRGTEMPGADSMSDKEIRQTAAYVRTLGKVQGSAVPGNAALGANVYRGNGGCTGCHSIRGDAGISGPDLAGIGERRSASYLREALLNPGSAVPDSYMLVTAVPKAGNRITGVRVNEDSFSIQIRDAAGRTHSFWKTDLAELSKQRGKSPMPSYQGKLSDEEVTNLVAYLVSLKEEK